MDQELELTSEQEARNDVIDNAVYDCILALAEKNADELPWDMSLIGSVTDAIKSIIWNHSKLRVRHPGIVTNDDGSQFYKEYDYMDLV